MDLSVIDGILAWLAAYGYWITIFMLLVFVGMKKAQPAVKAIFEDPLMGSLSVLLQPIVSVLVVLWWLVFALIIASWAVPLVASLISQILSSMKPLDLPKLPSVP